MSIGWKPNEIDVYLSEENNAMGETDFTFGSSANFRWIKVSSYGLLRSRVVVTPSATSGDTIDIFGRNGTTYNNVKYGNAKLEFEVLVADIWPYGNVNTPHEESDPWPYLNSKSLLTIESRKNVLLNVVRAAKRVGYVQPGRNVKAYYNINKLSSCTITDAYEQAMVIKVSYEIEPFEYYMDIGNYEYVVDPDVTQTATNMTDPDIPYESTLGESTNADQYILYNNGVEVFDVSHPIFKVQGSGVIINCTRDGEYGRVTFTDAPANTYLDTGKMLAYTSSGSANRKFTGDYKNLWIRRRRYASFDWKFHFKDIDHEVVFCSRVGHIV